MAGPVSRSRVHLKHDKNLLQFIRVLSFPQNTPPVKAERAEMGKKPETLAGQHRISTFGMHPILFSARQDEPMDLCKNPGMIKKKKGGL